MILLEELAKRGWNISVDIEYTEGKFWYSGSIWRGDSNCPVKGRYNPANGHGFNYFATSDDSLFEIHEIESLAVHLNKAVAEMDLEPLAEMGYE